MAVHIVEEGELPSPERKRVLVKAAYEHEKKKGEPQKENPNHLF